MPAAGCRRQASSRTSSFWGVWEALTIVPLVVGGPARVVALLVGVGLVPAIGVLVCRVAKSGSTSLTSRPWNGGSRTGRTRPSVPCDDAGEGASP